MKAPAISVLVVVRDEARSLERCLASLLSQTIPKAELEILIIDGISSDGSKHVADSHGASYPKLVRVIDNPKRTLAAGWNLGIQMARAPVVLRLDAHAEVPPSFLARNLEVLAGHPEAMCVGGRLETKGTGWQGRAIAQLQSSFFGAGGSPFRTGTGDGYVDTLAFGAYRKDIFGVVGLLDERLVRNQDLDLHRRMRERGFGIYLDGTIKCTYYARLGIRGLVRQGFQNGVWVVKTLRSARIRHLIPALFIAAQVMAWLLWFAAGYWQVVAALYGFYLLLALAFSVEAAAKSRAKESLALPFFGAALHMAYGLGSWWGAAKWGWSALVSRSAITAESS